jgi:hypothetical protein
MKLKTQLVSYRIATFPAKNEKRPKGDSFDMARDAAAAHALMLAITLELPMPHLMAAMAKADELMREWGYSREGGES